MPAKEALEMASSSIASLSEGQKLEEETLAYYRRVAMVPAELLTLHKAAVNRYYDIPTRDSRAGRSNHRRTSTSSRIKPTRLRSG